MKSFAIDLGGTTIKLAVIINEDIAAYRSLEAEASQGLGRKLNEITENLLLMDKETKEIQALGLGIAFPGIVSSKEKKIITSNAKYIDASQIDLVQWGQQALGLSIEVDNDANAAMLGELHYGVAKGKKDAVLMILGTGVGTSAVMDGQLVRGRHYQAGCLGGHMVVNMEQACNCGNKGCLEANASTWALPILIEKEKAYRESPLRKEARQDFKVLREHYLNKDKLADKIAKQCASYWGAGIVNMIHAYDPECVILSGGVLQFEELIEPIKQWVWKYAWTPWGKVEILCAGAPQISVLLGLHHMIKSNF